MMMSAREAVAKEYETMAVAKEYETMAVAFPTWGCRQHRRHVHG
jgi:hypothetical protein